MRSAVSILLLVSMGCSTLDRGPLQRVHIATDPEGAAVELTRCGVRETDLKTPVTVLIPRRVKRCSILLHHDGYEPARVMLERKRAENPAYFIETVDTLCGSCDSFSDFFLSLAFGGLIWGAARGVDKMAGSDYVLEPGEVEIALVPDERREP